MRRILPLVVGFLVLLVGGSLWFSSRSVHYEFAEAPASVSPAAFRFTVLHTNDLHSHLAGSGPDVAFHPEVDPSNPVQGHTARLLSAIARVRAERAARGEPVLLVDAGDFFGGTLFEGLGPSDLPEAPELEFLQKAGYDAVTLGNHEYDAGEAALAKMLAKKPVPLITTNLENAGAGWPGVRSMVKTLRSGDRVLRVLLLGIAGPDAARTSMAKREKHHYVGLNDETTREELPKLVDLLQREIDAHLEDTDVRIVIAHAGEPEDAKIAARLRHLDLFVAGHTHQLYRQVRQVGGTLIAQAGCYGAFLGNLELAWYDGALAILNPASPFIAIDGNLAADGPWLKRIDQMQTALDPLIAPMGFKSRDVVFTLKEDLRRGGEIGDPYGIKAITLIKKALDKRLEKPLDLYVTSLGLIRDDLLTDGKGPTKQLFSDVFRVFAIGFDEHLRPGSPVTDFYAKKEDFLQLIRFLEFYRHFSGNFTPIFSDDFSYRPRLGIPMFTQVADAKFRGKDFADWPELMHVGTSMYVAAFFPKLKKLSAGWVDPSPREANGDPKLEFKPVPNVNEATLFAEGLQQSEER